MKIRRANKGGLGSRASNALGWSFLNNIVARFSTMGIGVALARILGPHEFGDFAVAIVALLALLSFNELGVSLAIVRWEGDPREIVPTVTTISVTSSIIIYVGCFFAAPSFASAMGAPGAANVIRVLAINVIFDGLVSTPVALMQRYFRQDKKMIADQVNNWVGTGTSIGLALLHFGAMSLAIGRLAGAAVAAVLFIAFSPQPIRFGFDRAKARELMHFGTPLASASIVVFAVQNADQLVVGHILGATALGYYALAFNLSSWPINIFSMPIRSVAPALFSRLQHDRSAMHTSFLACLGLVESATLPICLLVSGAAVPLVHFVYGGRWTPAAEALVWLGGLAALRILFEFIYDYFVVLARSRVVFTVQLVWLIVLIPALIVGTWRHGISGAAMAEVAVGAFVVLPWYIAELHKVGIKRLQIIRRLWLPLLAALLTAGAAYEVAHIIPQAFTACAVSGAVALTVIGLLAVRMWPPLQVLRTTLRESTTKEAASVPGASAADEVSTTVVDLAVTEPTQQLAFNACAPTPGAVASTGAETSSSWFQPEPRRFTALLADTRPMPASQVITGPFEEYREPGIWTPIYQQTVEAMRWDPSAAPQQSPDLGRALRCPREQ